MRVGRLRKKHAKLNFIGIFILLILLALACNYPGVNRTPGQVSASELRATLEAQSFILTQVAAGLATAAFPGGQDMTPGAGPPVSGTAEPGAPFPPAPSEDFPNPAAPGTPTPGELPLAFTYLTRSGDTLPALALRFGVDPGEIVSTVPLESRGYLPKDTLLGIPNRLEQLESAALLLPDSEVVNSPSVLGFQLADYIQQAGGYLAGYRETLAGIEYTGAEIVERVAIQASINPRLLLSILEYQSGWVWGEPLNDFARQYPIGFGVIGREGLYEELVMTASHLGIGYYGWRSGSLLEIRFADRTTARLSPEINAGTAALLILFARLKDRPTWTQAMFGPQSLPGLHAAMFGDPWGRDASIGPLLPDDLRLDILELPFLPGERWGFTGGPHLAWLSGSPLGAIDFSPVTGQPQCETSRAWATAVAPGYITRAAHNLVALDIDGDGNEQTGWVIIYLHIARQDMIAAGSRVEQDARIGHPSCEGGQATGAHIHLARKYNGEWIAADGPVPFILSGWQVVAGERSYQGQLVKGAEIVTANPGGPSSSVLVR